MNESQSIDQSADNGEYSQMAENFHQDGQEIGFEYDPENGEHPEDHSGEELEGEYQHEKGEDNYEHEEEGEHHFEGHGDQEEEYDDDLNFENDPEYANLPPLDPHRKMRRNILLSIKEFREKKNSGTLFLDPLATEVADKYAEYLLTNEEDKSLLDQLIKEMGMIGNAAGLVGCAFLEEDVRLDEKTLNNIVMDAHGLLLELEEESTHLLKKEYNHIGIGIAFNHQKLRVVEILSSKVLTVMQLGEVEDGGVVEIRGQMLSNEYGLYAARIVAISNMKKELAIGGPPLMQVDKQTRMFISYVKAENMFYREEATFLELYVRKKPETIPYGQPSNERLNVEHLELVMRLPMILFPDPRTSIEDAYDKEKEEREAMDRAKRLEEDKIIQEAERQARKEERRLKRQDLDMRRGDGQDLESVASSTIYSQKSGAPSFKSQPTKKTAEALEPNRSLFSQDEMRQDALQKSNNRLIPDIHKSRSASERQSVSKSVLSMKSQEDDHQLQKIGSEIDKFDQTEDEDEYQELPSQNEMKKELESAIADCLKEKEELKRHNDDLQKQIISLKSKTQNEEKPSDVSMNEHKYLNTLANVHQVRYNLKETQDRYNKMASELQAKLNEKQQKCNEIQEQFKELKRSVAQNAVFNRTGKKIPKKMLEEWEQLDTEKDTHVHEFRLQNIALRNKLSNKEKILKKKEQLADGLHLIDFEQLKIENQTLNEKIEERNEELHKLRKKILTTVIILTHTREKLQYVQEENQVLAEDLEKNDKELNGERKKLTTLKYDRDTLRNDNQKLKQTTGIVNSKYLKKDFENLANKKKSLTESIDELKKRHEYLTKIIEQGQYILAQTGTAKQY